MKHKYNAIAFRVRSNITSASVSKIRTIQAVFETDLAEVISERSLIRMLEMRL